MKVVRRSRVGIREVAALANVSISTVSNVLNGTKKVSPALTERVLKAANSLNYQVNSVGRSLRTRRTNRIAVVVPTVTSVFFPDLLKSIQRSARLLGFSVSIFDTEGEFEREQRIIQYLCSQWYDGILLSSCADSRSDSFSAYIDYLQCVTRSSSAPTIICLEASISNQLDAVVVNDSGGIQTATEYLISIGRRSIAYIASPYQFCMGKNRRLGYESALRQHDIPVLDKMIFEGNYRCSSGYAGMQVLLSRNTAVDAIVAGNDQMAIGAIAYLIEKGIRIPEEIAVIGFNDNVQSSLITPSLSTIHVPKKEMGAKAIELFDRRHNNKTAVRILIQLEGHLVIRNTTDPNVTSCWNLDW